MFEESIFKAPDKSQFDLSHEKKLTMRAGELIPIYLQEVVPGDKFNIRSEVMIRLQPMVAPAYVRLNSYIHYFFVPNRLIWSDWEKFITGEDIATPKVMLTQSSLIAGTLWDYFGLPTENSLSSYLEVSDLPMRAYKLIWNEYYRDQNLQP